MADREAIARTAPDDRLRLRTIEFSMALLSDLLLALQREPTCIVTPLPPDLRVICCYVRPEMNSLLFWVHSREFPICPEGAVPEPLDLTFEHLPVRVGAW